MKLASLTSLSLATLLFAASPALAEDETTILRDYPYQSVADLRQQDFTIDASVPGALADLQVGIYMLHPRRGDVSLTLITPSGKQLRLKRASATDRGRNIGGVFGLNINSAEALTALQGEELSGTWTLRVADHRRGGVGTLVVWSLHATVAEMTTTPTNPTPTPTGKRFEVIIENLTGDGAFATPLAPGAYALHRGGRPLLGRGLEAMAEDGNPSELVDTMMNDSDVIMAGAFNTPDGANEPGPAFPGGAYRFEVEAMPGDKLSLATMLGQTNDAFVASKLDGVALFDNAGMPLNQELALDVWDAGTEANEAPGMGPNQAPRQAGPNTGAAESGVRVYTDSTRALPLAQEVVKASVRRQGNGFMISLENVSGRAVVSPVSPPLFATHTNGATLFTTGERAPQGLEALAEDGNPMELADALKNDGAFGSVQTLTDVAGPVRPGEMREAMVTPTATFTHFSLATMIGRTNDAFISNAGAVALVENGRLRSARAVEADLNAALAVFDAGTEANQAPGVGSNIAPNQAAPNTGPRDADDTVRRYSDSTNDFASDWAHVTVRPIGTTGSFEVTIHNTSERTGFPGRLTTPVYTVHDGSVALFRENQPAPGVIAAIAEEGQRDGLINALRGLGNRVRLVDAAPGGFGGGQTKTFTVTADRTRRFLNVTCMLVPTNDAFLALGPVGLELIDANGNIRSEAALNADLASMDLIWDAGSEINEAGGAGGTQPPAVHDAGPDEGNGQARIYNDPTWTLPSADRMVRVRVRAID